MGQTRFRDPTITINDLSILLLDPNQINQEILKQSLLINYRGFGSRPNIASTINQNQALSEILKKPENYWGIIMDMRLNGSGINEGLNFMEKLRNKRIRVPIIAYSGAPILNNDDNKRFYLNGGIGYNLIPNPNENPITTTQRALKQFIIYHQLHETIKNAEKKPQLKIA